MRVNSDISLDLANVTFHFAGGSWTNIRKASTRNAEGVMCIDFEKLCQVIGKQRGYPVTQEEIEAYHEARRKVKEKYAKKPRRSTMKKLFGSCAKPRFD